MLITSLILALIAIFVVRGLYTLFNTKGTGNIPMFKSLTRVGPLLLFKNPLEFAKQGRKLHGDVFQCWLMGKKWTFVFGQENVKSIVSAENHVANFESAYQTFLTMAFGRGILTKKTAPKQLPVLQKYLRTKYVQSYIQPTSELIGKMIDERLGQSGEVNLQRLLLDLSFTAGTRNFLGDKFLETLKDYDYETIFGGFEMGGNFVIQYLPFLKGIIEKLQKPSTFDKAVIAMVENTKVDEDGNMFELVVQDRNNTDGPTDADDRILINMMKIIVFGSGFNGYNMLSYFFRATLGDDELYRELRDEQVALSEKYPEASYQKLNEMNKLYKALMTQMYQNTFPFLLRCAEEDIPLENGSVVSKGSFVAYSPQIEHEGTSFDDDAQFNLIFGRGTHACPARQYALNTMLVIGGTLIQRYKLTPISAKPMVNNRLITFSPQTEIRVKYERY